MIRFRSHFKVDFSLIINTYALLMNPLARSLEELLPDRISSTYWSYILIRTTLVASTVCAAFLIPFFGKSWTLSLKYIDFNMTSQLVKDTSENNMPFCPYILFFIYLCI